MKTENVYKCLRLYHMFNTKEPLEQAMRNLEALADSIREIEQENLKPGKERALVQQLAAAEISMELIKAQFALQDVVESEVERHLIYMESPW